MDMYTVQSTEIKNSKLCLKKGFYRSAIPFIMTQIAGRPRHNYDLDSTINVPNKNTHAQGRRKGV